MMKDIYGRPIPSPVICEGCKQQISGEVVEALGKKWHPKCFVCPGFNGKRCGLLLKGTFYTGEDGKGYCETHYYESIGLLCCECRHGIESGQVVTLGNKKFHPEHFRCNICKKNLIGISYKKHEEIALCSTCYQMTIPDEEEDFEE